jgi:hypothetical protein
MPTKRGNKRVMPRAVARMKDEETPAQKKKWLVEEKKMKGRR